MSWMQGEICITCGLNVKKRHLGKISGKEDLFSENQDVTFASTFLASLVPLRTQSLAEGSPPWWDLGFHTSLQIGKYESAALLLGSCCGDGDLQPSSIPCQELTETSPELFR